MKKILQTKRFIRLLVKRVKQNDSVMFSYQLAYSLILSFFPFLIFLFTLLGFLELDASGILYTMKANLPDSVYRLIEEIVLDIVGRQRIGLMSASALSSVYFASGGFRAFMKGADRAMGAAGKRGFILQFLLSMCFVLLLAFTLMAALSGIVFGRRILSLALYISPDLPYFRPLRILAGLVPAVFILFLCTLLYMFVPAGRVRFQNAFPGAAFSTPVWMVLTYAFKLYADNCADYSKFYGALGTVIVLMLWLLLTSVILLVGIEINALLIRIKSV